MGGDSEAHRAHQMRRGPEPDVALGQRPADAKKMATLQPGQIAMNKPRRRRGRAPAKIALLQQDHAQTPPRCVARNADAVQAATDNRQIVIRHTQRLPERAVTVPDFIAFSSEVNTGWQEENAPRRKVGSDPG